MRLSPVPNSHTDLFTFDPMSGRVGSVPEPFLRYKVGSSSPVIVQCRRHSTYEAHGFITSAMSSHRSYRPLILLAYALIAAYYGDCRAGVPGVEALCSEYLRLVKGAMPARAPLASYLTVLDLARGHAPLDAAWRALAQLPIPLLDTTSQAAKTHWDDTGIGIDTRTGHIVPLNWRPGTTPGPVRIELPPYDQDKRAVVAVLPCRTHGWDVTVTTAGYSPDTLYETVADLLVTAIACWADDCDQFDRACTVALKTLDRETRSIARREPWTLRGLVADMGVFRAAALAISAIST